MTIAKSATIKLFDVSGKFIIPGTRETATFSARVIAESRHQGSRDLAMTLTEKFGEKLPRGHKFSGDFALYHLQWKEHAPKVKETLPSPILEAMAQGPVVVEASS